MAKHQQRQQLIPPLITRRPICFSITLCFVAVAITVLLILVSIRVADGIKGHVISRGGLGRERRLWRDVITGAVLVGMNACMTVGCVVGFTCWSVTVTRREMWGRAERIRQMEAAREAERKSMRKIDAFAGASHEVRTALAGITGLIHMCRAEVPPGSSLDFNLNHIDSSQF